jgi:DNA polymerase-3 subunit beta
MSNSISVKVSKAVLANALGKVQSVVQNKNAIAILANVKIDALKDKIIITATDMDITISETVPAEVDIQGSLTLDARKLYDIARKSSGEDDISIRGDADSTGKAQIKSKGFKFTLPCLNSDEFPAMDKGDADCEFNISSSVFLSLLSKVRFAISNDELKYMLNGINLKFIENELIAYATNGHKLAKNTVTLENPIENFPEIIIPQKAIGLIAKAFEGSAIDLNIQLSANKILIQQGDLCFVSKLIDGQFPEVERVFPNAYTNKIEISKDGMLKAIDRVSLAATGKDSTITINVSPVEVIFSASGDDGGDAEEVIELENEITQLKKSYNFKYLIEILSGIDNDTVVIHFNDTKAPAVIQNPNNDNEVYLVMPINK